MCMANRVADAYLQKNGASLKSEPDMSMAMSEDQTERFKRITRDMSVARRELLDKLSEAIMLLASQGDMRSGSPEKVAFDLLSEYEDQVKNAPDLNPQGEWLGGGREPQDVSGHRYRWPNAIANAARTFYRK